MEVTGMVTRVIRSGGPAWGSVKPYRRVTLQREGGNEITLKYLSGYGPDVAKGLRVTIAGMPMVGCQRVNIGGVTVTVHE